MVYYFNSVTGLLFFEQVVHFFIDIYSYFVHVANPLLIKKYFDAEIGKAKTDRKDAFKLSLYGTEKWFKLTEHSKTEQT